LYEKKNDNIFSYKKGSFYRKNEIDISFVIWL